VFLGYPEEGGRMPHSNVGTCIPVYMEVEEDRNIHQHRFGSLKFSWNNCYVKLEFMLKRRGVLVILRSYSCVCLEGVKRTRKYSFVVAGFRIEIQTADYETLL
jgi:hypothetical protein